MPTLTFWLDIPQDIRALKTSFQELFDMPQATLGADENWDWISGESHWPPARVNVFKYSDRQSGGHDQPVIVRISFSRPETVGDRVIEKIGHKMQEHFGVGVDFGEILSSPGADREYVVEKRFLS